LSRFETWSAGGTRDELTDLELLRPVCDELGSLAKLYTIEGADHSFYVLKRSGQSDENVLDEIARETRDWFEKLSAVAKS
jgi:hypothetical protein